MENLEPDGQYCDLLINFKTTSIKVHKVIVCEKFSLIKILTEQSVQEWPPVHTITLDLPDVTESSFSDAIQYIYTEKPNDDIFLLIKALIFLECDMTDILKLTRKSLKNEGRADLLLYIIELYPDSPFLNFYGHEFNISPIDQQIMFGLKPEDLLIEKYNTRRRFPPYIVAKQKKWFHFDSFLSGQSQEIKAFGLDWCIDRFLFNFGYGDKCDFVKIYINESYESPPGKNSYNIRANFIIYSLKRDPKIEIVMEDELVPHEYKATYMRRHHVSNTLGFNMYKYDEKMIRISLLMELL
jgi:hypothetical protein